MRFNSIVVPRMSRYCGQERTEHRPSIHALHAQVLDFFSALCTSAPDRSRES